MTETELQEEVCFWFTINFIASWRYLLKKNNDNKLTNFYSQFPSSFYYKEAKNPQPVFKTKFKWEMTKKS